MTLRAVQNLAPSFKYLGSDTFANITANWPAASYSGYWVTASDVGANGTILISNGTRWRPFNGRASLKDAGAGQSGIANSNTIVLQTLLPSGLWQANDEINIEFSLAKTGTTDALNAGIYIGTAGTTSDTAIVSAVSAISAANQTIFSKVGMKLVSATSVQKYSNSGFSYGAQSTATGAPVTISSATSNALYVSLAIQSSGATNTVAIQGGQIIWVTP